MIDVSCRLARPRFTLDVAFAAPAGCVALFGPSGSGKTTLARAVAGLERPDRGRIVIGDRVLFDSAEKIDIPAHQRRVGFVFQDGQLLPHLTVRQNLDYGRSFAPSDAAQATGFETVVELLGIAHLLAARPATLSGGERQRVAIGRALLAAPRLLVMDEPLASLDAARKLEILPFIERLRDELSLPIVYVSHALDEVARLATSVVKLSEGRVAGQGTPSEVFASVPGSAAERFEMVSFLSGTVSRERFEFGMTVVAHPSGDITLPSSFGPVGRILRVAVRATDVSIATQRPQGLSIRTALAGRVIAVATDGSSTALVRIELAGGDTIAAYVTRLAVADLGLAPGRDVFALIKAVAIDERIVATA